MYVGYFRYTIETVESIRYNPSEKESMRIKLLTTRLKDIIDWGDKFDTMTAEEQNAILKQLIERIDVTQDYNINITFAVSLEDFFGEESNKIQAS